MDAKTLLKPVVIFLLVVVSGLGVAQGWMTTQRGYEIRARLPIDPPKACQSEDPEAGNDACLETLTGEGSALPLVGVPVAAAGTGTQLVAFMAALWLALALFAGSRRHERWAMAALSVAAAIASAGTLLYLGYTLILWTWCGLCMRMHLLALILGLGVGVMAALSEGLYSGKPPTNRWAVAMMCLLTLLSLAGVSKSIDVYFTARYNSIAKEHAQNTPAYNDLIEECSKGTCVKSLVVPINGLPRQGESLVLSDAKGPALVEMIDMSCPHCARTHREFLSQWYRKIIEDRSFGLQLVLWPSGKGCNSGVNRFRPASCKSNTALLCAYREAPKGKGASKALEYMDVEFSLPTRQAPFPGGREAWLEKNVSKRAVRCYQKEMDKGDRGTLSKHINAAKRLKRLTRKHRGCGNEEASDDAWWCFRSTPSLAVVSKKAPRGSTSRPKSVSAAAEAVDRQRLLELRDCLDP